MAPDSPVTTATVEAALTGDTVAQAKIQAVIDIALKSRVIQSVTDVEEAHSFISVSLWQYDVPVFDDTRSESFEAYIRKCATNNRCKRFLSSNNVMTIEPQAVTAYVALLAECNDDVQLARTQITERIGTVAKFDAITSALARDYPDEENIMQGGFDPATVFDTQPAKERVEELLGNIDTLDAEIIGLSFGLDGEPMTDEQIAEWVGLSRSRVTQRRLRGMETMGKDEQS
jgi:DNA-directed RNA polymerase specialized sigma subunit